MGRTLLRALGLVGYGLALSFLFGLAAYNAFNTFVRSGVTTVPDVAGIGAAEARAVLADAALGAVVAERGRYDAGVPAGHVFEQRPRSGSLVKRRSSVELVVSMGPQRLEVPDLRGKDTQSARLTLTAAGLRPGQVRRIYASTGRPGTVVDQVPGAGTRAGSEAIVELWVCQENVAETYLMPDLLYRDYRVVQRFFQGRGFRIGSVKFEPYEGVPDGTVLRQLPLAGHPVRADAAVSLVVAAAREGVL